jgi:hypothetical protein
MPVKVSQTVLVSAVVLAALGSLLLTNLFYAALWKNDLQRVLGQWIRSHPAEDAVTNAAQIVKAHADSAAQIVKAHADSAAQTDDSNAATSISSKEIELAKCLVEADSFLASEMCWSIAKDKFMSSSLDLLRHVSKADLDHQFATVKVKTLVIQLVLCFFVKCRCLNSGLCTASTAFAYLQLRCSETAANRRQIRQADR